MNLERFALRRRLVDFLCQARPDLVEGMKAARQLAPGGATPYHYQWQVWMGEKKGWVDLDGAVISALIVKDVTMAMSGRKARCIVTDSSGQRIISDAATLTVIDPQMVDTGDHSNLPLYVAVALAALALIWLLRRRTRQGE